MLALIPAVHLFNLGINPSGGRRWGFAFVVVWILFLLWVLVRRRQLEAPAPAQIHLGAEGCRQFDVARAEAGLAQPPTPWSKIDGVVVKPVWENRVRIKLVEQTPWWKLERVRVDAEIAGGPDLLAALDARPILAPTRARGRSDGRLSRHPAQGERENNASACSHETGRRAMISTCPGSRTASKKASSSRASTSPLTGRGRTPCGR